MSKSADADKIIKIYVGIAIVAAATPLPVADVIAISGVQIAMLTHLGKVYEKTISKDVAKGLIGVAAAGQIGQFLASGIKFIPGAGTFIGEMAQMIISGGITNSLGIGIKKLLTSDNEIDKKNLKDILNDKGHKKEVRDKRDLLKKQLQKTKQAEKEINFYVNPESFDTNTTFYFNVSDYKVVKLTITDINKKILFEKQIDTNLNSLEWKPKELEDGKYHAYLYCDDLIPYRKSLKKNK